MEKSQPFDSPALNAAVCLGADFRPRGSACLREAASAKAGVDPEQASLPRPLKAEPGAAEWVKPRNRNLWNLKLF
jgi:hypothetical protein